MKRFAELLRNDVLASDDDEASLVTSLAALGVPESEWGRFLSETALTLRGWSGMFRAIESRPDRVPVHAPPARLSSFLAVWLLVERAVVPTFTRKVQVPGETLAALRLRLRKEWSPAPPDSPDEAAWRLFQVSQLIGLTAPELDGLTVADLVNLSDFVDRYNDVQLRRLLHDAFERSYHGDVLDALASHEPIASSASPAAQVLFCIDEREESMRRHLEEVLGDVETLGYAGFFGVPMYYRGLDDAHGRPLAPIAIQPAHEVRELPSSDVQGHVFWRRLAHREASRLREQLAGRGTTLVRGTVLAALGGLLTAVPLVARVLFPGLTARFHRRTASLLRPHPITGLAVERMSSEEPTLGEWSGFTIEEMAAIVAGVLEDVGLTRRLAPLVVVLGHGSVSLNNPHESAHDCGACGGGRGGPNARAFAHMANAPGVRAVLAARGTPIPATTWFVGGEHNTCHDGIELFDLALVPPTTQPGLERLVRALDESRARNAHERCRRFESFPGWLPERLALAHVESRSHDLAQPRPEYGHATNAMCIVGRRELTRGLFLDRRAFLVSYDPVTDPDGRVLNRMLAAAIPVVVGINLEYYFSVVDPTGYGCGTKLPHNVSGLLGVMDGPASDLRTGLPFQMVEIHEAVRLLVVVDAPPERLAGALEANPSIHRLARNGWFHLVARDPDSHRFWKFDGKEFKETRQDEIPLRERRSSREWYGGHRGHLPIACIVPTVGATG